jgi:hypothetical protein
MSIFGVWNLLKMKRSIANTTKGVTALFPRKLRIDADRIPYTFEDISTKKLLNAFLAELSILLKLE